ncbi:MAG: AAA family ATPase [Pseudomonadota bacterium]
MTSAVRVNELTLNSYGHFHEQSFAFHRPKGGPDLHLVVGANEAGKTTIRHALMDVLFGIPSGSNYLFRVGRPMLSASLDIDGEEFVLTRAGTGASAKPKDALQALRQALERAGMKRDVFLRTQAFSHSDMRAHAQELLQSNGELSKLLLRDAGGLGVVEECLAELRDDAAGLYSRDGRKKTKFRERRADWDAAQAGYDEAKLEAPHYADLRRAVEVARDDVQAKGIEVNRLRAQLDRLTNLIKAEPIAAEVRRLDDHLAKLEGPELAKGARDRVDATAGHLATVEAKAAAQAERIGQLETARDAIPMDPDVLVAGDAIDALATEQAALKALDGTRAADRLTIDTARRNAFERASGIGLPEMDFDTLALRIPPELARKAIAKHMATEEALLLARETAKKLVAELQHKKPPEPFEGPDDALLVAAAAFDELGRFEQDADRFAKDVASAKARLRAAEEAAAGDEDCAEPPPVEDGEAAENAIATAQTALSRAEEALERSEDILRRARRNAEHQAAAPVPSAEALNAARTDRDALFTAMENGQETVQSAAPRYRDLVARADGVADGRFAEAERIHGAQAASRDLRAAEEERAAAKDLRDGRRTDLLAFKENWQRRLEDAGLSRPPASFAAWHARRHERLGAKQAHREAVGAQKAHQDRLARASELAGLALGRPVASSDGMLAQAGAMEKAVRSAINNASKRKAETDVARKAFGEEMAKMPALRENLARAEDDLRDWRSTLEKLAQPLGLSADFARATLEPLLDAYGAIEKNVSAVRDAQQKVDTVDQRKVALAAEIAAVATRLALEDGSPADVLLHRLKERLGRARQAEGDAKRLGEEIDEGREEMAAWDSKAQQYRTELAGDLDAAGLPLDAPMEDLKSIARQSDERRSAQDARADALKRLTELGFDWPSVAAELDADDGATRAANVEILTERVEGAGRAALDAAAEQGRAESQLEVAKRKSRSGSAAEMKLRQNVLETEMAELLAEAIRKRLEERVLAAARDAFVMENRSPILARASSIFAHFTGGAYDKLDAGAGAGSFITAHRVADNFDVGVAGLSDGTRDQLVASIRLAAATDCGVPFIADDLFVNADDGRAFNGFRALCELADARQVFYLTHHSHLVEVAQRAAGEGLNVVRLDAGAALPAHSPDRS